MIREVIEFHLEERLPESEREIAAEDLQMSIGLGHVAKYHNLAKPGLAGIQIALFVKPNGNRPIFTIRVKQISLYH